MKNKSYLAYIVTFFFRYLSVRNIIFIVSSSVTTNPIAPPTAAVELIQLVSVRKTKQMFTYIKQNICQVMEATSILTLYLLVRYVLHCIDEPS